MSNTRRRGRVDIEADILLVAQGGARKTRIVYQGNLNFKIVKSYLRDLMDRDLLIFRDPHYFATDRAKTYLSRYEALKTL